MEQKWIPITGFNTPTGFKEWLEEQGAKTKAKRQELVDRLMKGEVIEYGNNSRMRYEFKDGLGIFYIERIGNAR